MSDTKVKSRRITIKSAKAKGAEGQKEVVRKLLKAFPGLVGDDIRSTPMGSQGEDVLLSPAARKLIPWNIEVKRGKAFNLVTAIKQAEFRAKPLPCNNPDCFKGKDQENFGTTCAVCKGTSQFTYQPVAIGRYDQDKNWYATINLNYLLELIGGEYD